MIEQQKTRLDVIVEALKELGLIQKEKNSWLFKPAFVSSEDEIGYYFDAQSYIHPTLFDELKGPKLFIKRMTSDIQLYLIEYGQRKVRIDLIHGLRPVIEQAEWKTKNTIRKANPL